MAGTPNVSDAPAHPPHSLTIRIYYEDTDAGGIVYHAAYLRFAERARTELVRGLGIQQGALRNKTGLGFAVRSLSVDYFRPAYLDDEITVHTHTAEIRGASVIFEQVIMRADVRLARLMVRVACVDGAGRPRRLPPVLRDGGASSVHNQTQISAQASVQSGLHVNAPTGAEKSP